VTFGTYLRYVMSRLKYYKYYFKYFFTKKIAFAVASWQILSCHKYTVYYLSDVRVLIRHNTLQRLVCSTVSVSYINIMLWSLLSAMCQRHIFIILYFTLYNMIAQPYFIICWLFIYYFYSPNTIWLLIVDLNHTFCYFYHIWVISYWKNFRQKKNVLIYYTVL